MKIAPFKLERYFAQHEFTAPFLLCCSDCEPLSLTKLFALADDNTKALWNTLSLGYTDSHGQPDLRAEIASLYKKVGPDDVLVITPEEGIFIAMNTMLVRGDHIICTFPGYQSLYQIAESIGCDVSYWMPRKDREKRGWVFNVDDMMQYIRSDTKLIIINFPHNPTGSTVSAVEFRHLIDTAAEKNITVFSDEMYRFLEYQKKQRLPSAADIHPGGITLGGLSKSFSAAGLRIGWLASLNHDLMREVARYKDYTTICSSAPSEILALIALRSADTILGENVTLLRKNLGLLKDFFSDFADIFSWYKPDAGPVCFPAVKGATSAEKFCSDLLDKKGVLLLPAEVYDYLPDKWPSLGSHNKSNHRGNRHENYSKQSSGNDNDESTVESHFRIGFGRENMPQALEKLREYVLAYLGGT